MCTRHTAALEYIMIAFILFFFAALTSSSIALAADPAVSAQYGIIGAQIMRHETCNRMKDVSCYKFTNNTTYAVAFGFSYAGGGIQNALVTESGSTQCVLSPIRQCVSVIGPGEEGWIMFPSTGMVGVEISGWSMPGLDNESAGTLPGSGTPATFLGDPGLMLQGLTATRAWGRSCNINVGGGISHTYVNLCR